MKDLNMGIGRALDTVMDWAMEGNMPWAMTKLLGVCAIPVGIMAAPFIYVAVQNANELESTFEDLDSRPTAIFQSVAACVDEHYDPLDCEQSQKTAIGVSEQLGTTISYSGRSECVTNHVSCDQHTFMQPIIIANGKTTTTTYVPRTLYTPNVVAWQAVANDLSISVPLYQSSEAGMGVRKDGQMFNLGN